MSEIVTWVIIGIAAAILLAVGIYYIVKFFRLTPQERVELLIQFLIGLVSEAEVLFDEGGAGEEKLKWVEEQFNKTAPWFLKIVLKLTKATSLADLVRQALEKAKHIEWDKYKKTGQE